MGFSTSLFTSFTYTSGVEITVERINQDFDSDNSISITLRDGKTNSSLHISLDNEQLEQLHANITSLWLDEEYKEISA